PFWRAIIMVGGRNDDQGQKLFVSHEESKRLQCGLAISGHCFDTFEGEVKTWPSEQALTFFIFRLLQKLQSLGTVPAINWNAYAATLG
ncbi:MAG: hypothetical protein HQL90_15775, partial [Magnetococcales bacterium]|nr:hypothetical protein [Magnetococcales bacterium]